jgi:lactocepin
MNSKIPFAYDYADKDSDVAPFDSNHGTHVAGIIGGKDDVITGVAVNTQLVLMKVFGDINNGALQDDILAALEDAILLGVDAINLSLGSACGFSRSSDDEYINVVYDQIEAAGISLVVAASNDYSSGYGGENSNTNKASNPDSATVGSPGTYGSTIAVASISGVKSKYIISEDGYTFFFNNANNNTGEAYDFYEMLYKSLDSKEKQIEGQMSIDDYTEE